jgi:acyl transferase domain-containing protein
MGKELMEDYESFRADMQKMDDSLAQLKHTPSWKISDKLLKSDSLSNIHKAEISQPLCTAVQAALVNLLQRWEYRPAQYLATAVVKSPLLMPQGPSTWTQLSASLFIAASSQTLLIVKD